MAMTTPPAWAPAPEDEFPHAPPGTASDLPWKDTWLFVLRDHLRDTLFATHLTVSPNRAPGCRTAWVVVDGGREATASGRSTIDAGCLGNDLLALRVQDPSWDDAKRVVWRGGDARLSFELRVRGVNPAIEFGGLCPGILPRTSTQSLHHVEQWVTFEGWVRWAGEERVEVAGEGYRDRSWGWRKSDRSFAHGWVAVLGRLGDDTFGVLQFRHADVSASADTPVAAWVSGPSGVAAGVAGDFQRESTGRPRSLTLSFADGRAVDLAATRHTGLYLYAFHDVDESGVGIQAMECFADVEDTTGRPGLIIADYGTPILADAFRGSRFLGV